MSNLATSNSSNPFAVNVVQAASIAEKVIAENGDLYKLTAVERKIYYMAMCDRYKLDPFSSPFDYLSQKMKDSEGKYRDRVTLYPNQRASNFFAQKHKISCLIKDKEFSDGLWMVTVIATAPDGRQIEDVGAVSISDRINRGDALKKAISQARRRAILALCGFSTDDEFIGNAITAETYDMPIDALESIAATATSEPIPFNREPTNKAILAATKRLKWDPSYVKTFLNAEYGVEDWRSLSDLQLMEVCNELESMATPVKAELIQAESPIKREVQ